ncbi:DUF1272 domain-containing protein [Streptomyces roseicoloratus]|uniref:DUF1272 domain-containing protein n=1 Tax=Streptomyces roseicoloratus TaxID=2508722 RepID=A0ABY9RRS7_9ACTN|nr:DUF1272 domain-containing protein [Streptomyces roseicoloratus]WMX44191.1 DUF1272 domain-containing protein [Streptomyces roseicoloratus]
MLRMRPRCMGCAQPLAGDSPAFICSYECTWCPRCAGGFAGVCPNCAGELVRRPRRTTGAAAIVSRVPDRIRRFVRRTGGPA